MLVKYCIFLFFFAIQENGGIQFVDKTDKAKEGGRANAYMADEGGRGWFRYPSAEGSGCTFSTGRLFSLGFTHVMTRFLRGQKLGTKYAG